MGSSESKHAEERDEVTYENTEQGFSQAFRIHYQRLITYAQSADPKLQREVAERLANEAVNRKRSVTLRRARASRQKLTSFLYAVGAPRSRSASSDRRVERLAVAAASHQVEGPRSAALGSTRARKSLSEL
jgi:hypothetical protein